MDTIERFNKLLEENKEIINNITESSKSLRDAEHKVNITRIQINKTKKFHRILFGITKAKILEFFSSGNLEGYSDWNIKYGTNQEDIFKLLSKFTFDFIVLDPNLVELKKAIKSIKNNKNTQIIIFGHIESEEELANIPENSNIVKIIDEDQLDISAIIKNYEESLKSKLSLEAHA